MIHKMSPSSSSSERLHVLIFDGGRGQVRGCYGSWAILEWLPCDDPGACGRKVKRCPLGVFHLGKRACPEAVRREVVRWPLFALPHLNTSNESEWGALCLGLSALLEVGPVGKVVVVGDSKLVLNQITGRWRVWAEGLKPLHREARALLAAFDSFGCEVQFEWRPRHAIETWLGH